MVQLVLSILIIIMLLVSWCEQDFKINVFVLSFTCVGIDTKYSRMLFMHSLAVHIKQELKRLQSFRQVLDIINW